MKQETIREVVQRYYEDNIDDSNIPRDYYEWEIQDLMIGFAYQWQQEQDNNKFSEKEVKKLAFDFYYDMSHKMGVSKNLISENATNVDVWFKQFKNNEN